MCIRDSPAVARPRRGGLDVVNRRSAFHSLPPVPRARPTWSPGGCHRPGRAPPPVRTDADAPRQMELIKDRCGRFDRETRCWVGSVRDRFFFALLEETGLRLGEALSLQHRDWHSGGGENPFLEVVPRRHPLGVRVKGGEYRKLYVSDGLDRLYAEYLWQLCDAGMDTVVASMDVGYVFVNLAGG